jgi:hypothetical protein
VSLNFAHLHLLLNHFPIIGTMFGLGLFLVSFAGKNNHDLRRASLIIFVVVGFMAIPAFLTGFGAQAMMMGRAGISDALIQRHEGAAMFSLCFVEITGVLAILGLWQSRFSHPRHLSMLATLFFALVTMGLVIRTGNTGGEISHAEIHASQTTIATDGTLGAVIHAFEPTPDKLSLTIIDNRWLWAFLMAMHFLGLALIVGTVGILNARILGLMKQIPIAALHAFMPWAMAGLGINIVTGLLAFIGQPDVYIYSATFWLKMLALLLLGLNAAAFYLTNVFGEVELLAAGEDAPLSAKLIAASALLLWLAMIILGRYIQPLSNTVRIGSKFLQSFHG